VADNIALMFDNGNLFRYTGEVITAVEIIEVIERMEATPSIKSERVGARITASQRGRSCECTCNKGEGGESFGGEHRNNS